MPNYDIFILPESQITISGGEQLDGVTQGDGSHLVGETITLNSSAFQSVNIDDNDTDFEDNGGTNQELSGATTIDGVTFSAGTNVEAEYSFTVTDGTNTYTLIAFNVNNSSPSYATVEALAFIGTFPPIGVPLTVTAAQEGPVFAAAIYATPPCFCAGTLIRTPDGERFVQDLKAGDLVETLHDGSQPVRWVGSGLFPASDIAAPIRFKAGTIGNIRDLCVSPQHRLHFSGWQADLLFAQDDVLVAAQDFVDGQRVLREEGGYVEYFHILFDRHQIIFSEGVATESFFPGEVALDSLGQATRAEVLRLFPDLATGASVHDQTVYQSLKSYEAHVLLAH